MFKYSNLFWILLLLCACRESNSANEIYPTTPVTFTMSIPANIVSRADDVSSFSDGSLATQLFYAVYTVNGNNTSLYTSGTSTISNLMASLDLNLIIDRIYKVVFWAQSPDAPYSFNPLTGNININTDQDLPCNDDVLDAFCASTTISVGTASQIHKVTLHRPFAQINVGDTANNSDITRTSLIVSDVATTYSLLTGEKSNLEQCTFTMNSTPASSNISYPGDDEEEASYAAMAYVLPSDSQSVSVYLAFEEVDGYEKSTYVKTKDLGSVTVSPNNRTNISGDVYTLEDHTDYYLTGTNKLTSGDDNKFVYVGLGNYVYNYGANVGTASSNTGFFVYDRSSTTYYGATQQENMPADNDFTDDDKYTTSSTIIWSSGFKVVSFNLLYAHLNCEYPYICETTSNLFTCNIQITGGKDVNNLIIRFNSDDKSIYFIGDYA